MFPYILFPRVIFSAYSECGTTPGIQILSVLAALRLEGLKPVPSTCQGTSSSLPMMVNHFAYTKRVPGY